MHPEFRETLIRQRERELNATRNDVPPRERSAKDEDDPRALRLIRPDESRWAWALAGWRIAGS